jgi:hypothetical protein
LFFFITQTSHVRGRRKDEIVALSNGVDLQGKVDWFKDLAGLGTNLGIVCPSKFEADLFKCFISAIVELGVETQLGLEDVDEAILGMVKTIPTEGKVWRLSERVCSEAEVSFRR